MNNRKIQDQEKLKLGLNKPAVIRQRESQVKLIKQKLLKIQQKHKNMQSKKLNSEIPVICISSQADSQSKQEPMAIEGPLQPQIQSQSQQVLGQFEDEVEDDEQEEEESDEEDQDDGVESEQIRQDSGLISYNNFDQSSQQISSVQSQSISQSVRLQGGKQVQVFDVSMQTMTPRQQSPIVVLQIRDEDGQQLIDIKQYNQVKTYTRQQAQKHYLIPLIYYYQKHIRFDFSKGNTIQFGA